MPQPESKRAKLFTFMSSPYSNRYAERSRTSRGIFAKSSPSRSYGFMALTEELKRSTRPAAQIRRGLIVLTPRRSVGDFAGLHLQETHSDNQAASAASSVHEIGSELLLTTSQVCRWLTYANAGIGLSHVSTGDFPLGGSMARKKPDCNWCNSAEKLRVSAQELSACGFLEAAFPHCLRKSARLSLSIGEI